MSLSASMTLAMTLPCPKFWRQPCVKNFGVRVSCETENADVVKPSNRPTTTRTQAPRHNPIPLGFWSGLGFRVRVVGILYCFPAVFTSVKPCASPTPKNASKPFPERTKGETLKGTHGVI